MLRMAITLALRRDGFIVHGAGTPAEALALLRGQPRIVAIIAELDLGRGDAEGVALLAQVRAEWPALAIIILTGRPGLLLGRSAGAREAHLLKPCPMVRLVATLRRLIAG